MSILFFLPQLGCHDDDAAPAPAALEDTYVVEVPLPYEPELEDPTPEPSIDGLAEALEAAGPRAFELNGKEVVRGYDALFAGADETCPTLYEKGSGASLWYNSCSNANVTFQGYGYYLSYVDEPFANALMTGSGVMGQMLLTATTGETFAADGTAYWLEGPTTDGYGGTAWYSSVVGAFSWTDSQLGWLRDGDSAGVTLFVMDYASLGGRLVQASGSVVLDLDGAVWAVAFENTMLATAAMGSACPEEPGGVVSVRDPSGVWYDVAFDGPVDGVSNGDASRCDGCGDVYVHDELIGTVCPDFSSWIGWDGAPW